MEDPYPVENIDRLGVLMFQTSDNSQLLRRVLWINAELTIVSSLKHQNTKPIYIFNRENPQNSEPQIGPRRGLDYIALVLGMGEWEDFKNWEDIENDQPQDEALKKFRSVLSTNLSDSDLSQIKVNCFMKWIVVALFHTKC